MGWKFVPLPLMKVVVDDMIPFIRGQIERVADEVAYLPGHAICHADVLEADALIVRTRTRCDRDLLEGTRVQLVVTATVGYDHIDTSYLRSAGIRWANCPGCNATSVRQYVHNALLVVLQERGLLGQRLTCGVVGVGCVGSLVAADLQSMGMNVLLCDPPRAEMAAGYADHPSHATDREEEGAFRSLDELAQRCDIITFHPNLTRTGRHPSFHLADARFFRSLQRRPLIINTSRGEVVDNEQLLLALRRGQVGAAVIDTWEHEPDIDRQLLNRVLLGTPHIAGYSADGKANATRTCLHLVARHFGQDLHFSVAPPPLPTGFRYGPLSSEGPLRLYDPRIDCQRLRDNPAAFETLRGNYPLRRETDR